MLYSVHMQCFSTTIDLTLAAKLKTDLDSQGFTLGALQYALFQAKKPGLVVTLYESGKLTVMGKNKQEFIEFYLEPEILKDFSYSTPDLTPRIGVDEAGKGDYFGPLCICSVFANEETIPKLIKIGVKDSKSMGDAKILKLSAQITKLCPYSLIRISPARYNELYGQFHNLNSLLAWAHATVIAELHEKTGCSTVITDKFAHESLVANALKKKKVDLDLTQIHKGEQNIAVAAASIIARTAFVQGIEYLSKKAELTLPKGAGPKIITTGKSLVSRLGPECLHTYAKLHFKTTDEILNK